MTCERSYPTSNFVNLQGATGLKISSAAKDRSTRLPILILSFSVNDDAVVNTQLECPDLKKAYGSFTSTYFPLCPIIWTEFFRPVVYSQYKMKVIMDINCLAVA